jgi:hypothetical protein
MGEWGGRRKKLQNSAYLEASKVCPFSISRMADGFLTSNSNFVYEGREESHQSAVWLTKREIVLVHNNLGCHTLLAERDVVRGKTRTYFPLLSFLLFFPKQSERKDTSGPNHSQGTQSVGTHFLENLLQLELNLQNQCKLTHLMLKYFEIDFGHFFGFFLNFFDCNFKGFWNKNKFNFFFFLHWMFYI